jgi:GNAT superfamily N-acetyltransferase
VADLEIRRAQRREGPELTQLALRSKAYWGYSDGFLAACRAELTVTAAQVEADLVAVAMETDEIVGFYSLRETLPLGDVAAFFVEPLRIGQGIGRALLAHLVASAQAAGFACLRIEADPHAVAFYERHGAAQIGEVASGSIPGRNLPLLELRLSRGPEPAQLRAPAHVSSCLPV